MKIYLGKEKSITSLDNVDPENVNDVIKLLADSGVYYNFFHDGIDFIGTKEVPEMLKITSEIIIQIARHLELYWQHENSGIEINGIYYSLWSLNYHE